VPDNTIISRLLGPEGAAAAAAADTAVAAAPAAANHDENDWDLQKEQERRIRIEQATERARTSVAAAAAAPAPAGEQPEQRRGDGDGDDEDSGSEAAPAPAPARASAPSHMLDRRPAIIERPRLGEPKNDEEEGNPLVPVMHPHFVDVERRLGPKSADPKVDAWCYVCDVVDQMDQDRCPAEVNELLTKISEYKRKKGAEVETAMRIRGLFDATIRDPANAQRPDSIPQWTIWGIYNHMTEHMKSPLDILDKYIRSWDMAASTLGRRMYSTPLSLARSGNYGEENMHMQKADLDMLGKIGSKLLPAISLREKLRQSEAKGGAECVGLGTDAPLARPRSHRTGGAARVCTIGGSKR